MSFTIVLTITCIISIVYRGVKKGFQPQDLSQQVVMFYLVIFDVIQRHPFHPFVASAKHKGPLAVVWQQFEVVLLVQRRSPHPMCRCFQYCRQHAFKTRGASTSFWSHQNTSCKLNTPDFSNRPWKPDWIYHVEFLEDISSEHMLGSGHSWELFDATIVTDSFYQILSI